MKTTIASILLAGLSLASAQESAFPSTSSTPSAYPSMAPSPDSDNPLPPDKQPRSDFRCGITEVDARSNCKNECTTNIDCAEGEFCWSTFSNYCHLMPEGHPTCDPELAEETIRRCGFDEQSARSYCGLECENEVECPEGEVCFPVQRNLCECFEDQDEAAAGGGRRALAKTNREYFDDAKLVIAEFFLGEAPPPESAPVQAPVDMPTSAGFSMGAAVSGFVSMVIMVLL